MTETEKLRQINAMAQELHKLKARVDALEQAAITGKIHSTSRGSTSSPATTADKKSS